MHRHRTVATPLALGTTWPATSIADLTDQIVLAAERGGRDGRTAASIRFDSLDGPDEWRQVLDGLLDFEPAVYDWLPRPTFRYGPGVPAVVAEQYDIAYEVGVKRELERRCQIALGINVPGVA